MIIEKEYPFKKKYQVSKGYIHRKIVDTEVLISVGENIANFNGYIEMNESAAFLWEKLSKPCQSNDLEIALMEKYSISPKEATEDVYDFLKLLQSRNMVEVLEYVQ